MPDTSEILTNALGSALGSTRSEIDAVQAVLSGVNLTVAAMRDGVAAVGIAFNLFSGAVKQLLAVMAEGLSKVTFGDWSAQLKQAAADLQRQADQNYQAAHTAVMLLLRFHARRFFRSNDI